MPIEVELPDGSVVSFPDGTPNAVMEGALKAHHQSTWKPQQRSPQDLQRSALEYRDRNPVTNDASNMQNFVAGMGKSLVDTGQGIQQLYSAVADKVAPRAQTVGGLVSGQDNSRSAQVQREVDERRKIDDALMNTKAGIGGNMVGTGAQIFIPGADAAKAVSYTGRGAALIKGAAQAAPIAFVQPVATGESRLENTAINAGLGAAGAKIAPALRGKAQQIADAVRPEVRAVWEAAKARGIDLTPAQLSDSKFLKYLESKMRALPLSGAAAKAEQQKAVFNQRIAESIGVKNRPVVNDEVYAAAKKRDSMKFEALSARNAVNVKPELIGRLESAIADAKLAGDDVAKATQEAVERFYSAATTGPNGIIVPGKAYQALDSALGKVTRQGTPISHYVGQVKNAIRDAMDESISPRDKAEWSKLRLEYANRKTIRDLVAKAGGAPLSPAQLMGRVTATNHGKEMMATGRAGEMGELAKIGQRIKEQGTSGSPEGQVAYNALNPLNWPALSLQTLMGGTVGRAVNSNAVAHVVMREGRGNTINGLARLAEKAHLPKTLTAAELALIHNKKRD